MTTDVNACLETLLNPSGRLRTLGEVYPLRTAHGGFAVEVTGGGLRFSVITSQGRRGLTVRACDDPAAERRARQTCLLCERTANPHLPAVEYLEEEMYVYDAAGRGRWLDAVIETVPAGERLDDRALGMVRAGDRQGLLELVAALGRCVSSLAADGLVHGGMVPRRMIVGPDGVLRLTGIVTGSAVSAGADVWAAARTALVLWMLCLDPVRYVHAGAEAVFGGHDLQRFIMLLDARRREAALAPLVELVRLVERPAAGDDAGRAIAATVAACERLDRALSGCRADETARWLDARGLVDAEPACVSAGPLSDTLRAVYDRGTWRYVDRFGNTVIAGPFLHAEEFHEGRAVVETSTGLGLIDREGGWVLVPDCEDLVWNYRYNVVTVCREGGWCLCDRSGIPLTSIGYDYIGSCDEGLLPVCRGGRWGSIRADGTPVLETEWDDVSVMPDGRLRVVSQGMERFVRPVEP